MKHLSLLIFLLILPLVAAQTVNFMSNTLAPGEILQAEILTSEKLLPADIKLLNPYGYPTIFGINFIVLDSNYYFIYAAIPENSPLGTYILRIKDADFNFQITSLKDYSTFSPTFIKNENKDEYIQIKLTNHALQEKEYSITSSYDAVIPSASSLAIPPKSSKYFYVHIDQSKIKKSLIAILSINDYSIPVYIVKDVFPTQIISKALISEEPFLFYTQKGTQINYIKNTLAENQVLEDELTIKNNLNITLDNINLILTGNLDEIITLNKNSLDSLSPGEASTIEIVVNKQKSPSKNIYEGSLQASSSDYSTSLQIHFDIEKALEEPEAPKESLAVEEKTEKLPEEKPQKKSYTKYFAYLILILLAAVLYYYYFGKKEHKKEIKFTEYIKKLKP